MPRVVRHAPLSQRIAGWLNPFDHLLALSTDIDSYDWDTLQHTLGDPLGIGLNLLTAITRANADAFRSRYEDDVFSYASGRGHGSTWAGGLGYLVCESKLREDGFLACTPDLGALENGGGSLFGIQFRIISWAMVLVSIVNTVYIFQRKRRYRLFESNIEVAPTTPSARRVKVDSSPSAASPWRVISNFQNSFADDPASRAHPDETEDVWEVGVWDPTPLSLSLISYLSPVHVAVYFLSFPTVTAHGYAASASTSSASTIVTVLATQISLSIMLRWLQAAFIQQAKDMRIINKEVLHEYDTKFVQPRLNVRKRDAAVQCSRFETGNPDSVDFYTPAFDRQAFHTAPNPNYARLTWQSGTGLGDRSDRSIPPDSIRRPSTNVFSNGLSTTRRTTLGPNGAETPLIARTKMRQPQFERSTTNAGAALGRGTTSTATGPDDYTDDRGRNTMRMSTPNVGTTGLVNWNREQNRGLSPSKASTPLKGGRLIRASSYAESLGTPLGTPRHRRDRERY